MNWEFRPGDDRTALFANDPKFPWEVARHAVLPRLGVAWYVTHDARYAEQAAAIVLDWTGRYAVPAGLHASSALEAGIRLIAWCQAFHFFRSSAAFKGTAIESLLRHIAVLCAWLDGHLSTDRVVAGNHLLGELAGLIVADLYFPEMGEKERLGRNLALFRAALESQVAPDGVSLEQSAPYGRFVADFVAAVLAAARATGTGVPPALGTRAGALAGWLAALTGEDGRLPLVGDNDSGRGVDWGEPFPSNDARGAILTLATLTEDPAPLAGLAFGRMLPAGAETAFWWTGEEGLRRLAALARSAPRPGILSLFPAGGHAVIRSAPPPSEDLPGPPASSTAGRRDFIHVRCGPFGLGLPKPSAHSHADFMSPVVSLEGESILVDPGNFGYTTVGPARDVFRADTAHNLFRVAGRVLAEPGDTFRWALIPETGRLEGRESDAVVEIRGAWSPARLKGDKPVACARRLVYNKTERLIEIEDEWSVEASTVPYAVMWRWHFPPETRMKIGEEGDRFETALPGGALCAFELRPAATIRVEEGWVAPAYSRRRPAPVVILERPALGETEGRQVTSFRLVSHSGEVST